MTKKRKIEILELMKLSIESGMYEGLCWVSLFFCIRGKINNIEYRWITDLIRENKTLRGRFVSYYWKPFKVKPRIEWINARIKELQ